MFYVWREDVMLEVVIWMTQRWLLYLFVVVDADRGARLMLSKNWERHVFALSYLSVCVAHLALLGVCYT